MNEYDLWKHNNSITYGTRICNKIEYPKSWLSLKIKMISDVKASPQLAVTNIIRLDMSREGRDLAACNAFVCLAANLSSSRLALSADCGGQLLEVRAHLPDGAHDGHAVGGGGVRGRVVLGGEGVVAERV